MKINEAKTKRSAGREILIRFSVDTGRCYLKGSLLVADSGQRETFFRLISIPYKGKLKGAIRKVCGYALDSTKPQKNSQSERRVMPY
jgi:hypothetical protein